MNKIEEDLQKFVDHKLDMYKTLAEKHPGDKSGYAKPEGFYLDCRKTLITSFEEIRRILIDNGIKIHLDYDEYHVWAPKEYRDD